MTAHKLLTTKELTTEQMLSRLEGFIEGFDMWFVTWDMFHAIMENRSADFMFLVKTQDLMPCEVKDLKKLFDRQCEINEMIASLQEEYCQIEQRVEHEYKFTYFKVFR